MSNIPLARLPNERRIFTLLRTHGSMTRADMARRLSLTPSTLTNIVESLRERDLVIERRAAEPRLEREPGRPGVHIALSPAGAFFLGVEIGVGTIRFALLNLALETVAEETRPVSTKLSPEEAVGVIASYHARLQEDPGYRGRIQAAVLTVPGLVRDDGFVVHLPILGWRDINVRELAAQAIGLPTTVENNANAAAFGEVYTRPGIDRRCVVYLKLGTGCGGAVILNGRLLTGAFGMGGELGHLRIGLSGPRCSCGRVGCIEPNVTLGALARLTGAGETDPEALLRLPSEVAAAAAAGDGNAADAVRSIGESVASGVVTLVNIFNPSTVILGGPMRPVLTKVLRLVEGRVAAGVVPGLAVPSLEIGRLGELECAVGAATIAHHRAVDISYLDVDLA